jgi:hypothetical protein
MAVAVTGALVRGIWVIVVGALVGGAMCCGRMHFDKMPFGVASSGHYIQNSSIIQKYSQILEN